MESTKNLIVEQKGNKVNIYNKQVIYRIYSELASFCFHYNRVVANEIKSTDYKVTLDVFLNMNKSNDVGDWLRCETKNIKSKYDTSSMFGKILNPTTKNKYKKEIIECRKLELIYHTSKHIKDYYFTDDVFSFKHQTITNGLNPFSNDGNILEIKDKESVIKVIKQHEQITIKKDVWEQVEQYYSLSNFKDVVSINNAVHKQNKLIEHINANPIDTDVIKWDAKLLQLLITDKDKLIRVAFNNILDNYAKKLNLKDAETLLDTYQPSANNEMYNAAKEELIPLRELIENCSCLDNNVLGIYKSNIVQVDADNKISINATERDKALNVIFDCWEFDDNNQYSEERKKCLEYELNQQMGNYSCDDIWKVLTNSQIDKF